MWLLFKLIIAVGSFFFYILKIGRDTKFPDSINGTSFRLYRKTDKTQTVETSFIFPFKSFSLFKITKQTKWYNLFCALGLSDEVNTKDLTFDSRCYVASDCLDFNTKLQLSVPVRELIVRFFDAGGKSISCDGYNLKLTFFGDKGSDSLLRTQCLELLTQLKAFKLSVRRTITDRFALRVFVIEAFIWSVAAYAVTSFFEWLYFDQDYHLEVFQIYTKGILWGLFFLVIFLALIFLTTRGSSKSHRIVIESLIVLGLGLPASCIFLYADLNMYMDKSKPHLILAQVDQKVMKVHRGRRGRTSYSYHLYITPKQQNTKFRISDSIKVNKNLYSSVEDRSQITIDIGAGYFGHPWYRNIESAKELFE